ncbi:putative histone-binding protein lin-53 [Orchesella cincta]|uniref:Putative histone-binding protein lin-53 n=1 Tax=Orchesella cincta TaxID=48709 RepID=A0A1D2N687_ORCCI|nr:putative histone-binding protein lin-53 [Orchesella cincta]
MSSVNGHRSQKMKGGEGVVLTTSGDGVVEVKRENGAVSQLNGFGMGEQKLELNGNKKQNAVTIPNGGKGMETDEDTMMSAIEEIRISEGMDVDEEMPVGVSANGSASKNGMAMGNGANSSNGNLLPARMDEDPMMNGLVNPPPPPLLPPKCANGKLVCALDGSPGFPCKRCHRVFYCSESHRKQHYDEHQPDCKTVSSLEVIGYEEEYSMWLKHAAPHLYDVCLNFVLVWPSLSVQWLPEIVERENNILRHHLLLGTMTNQEQNHLLICGIDVPERNKTDNVSDHASKYSGTMYVLKRINHEAEVNRARYMPQDSNIVATKSSSPEVFIFDCSKYPEVPEDSKFSPLLRLRGHQKEG